MQTHMRLSMCHYEVWFLLHPVLLRMKFISSSPSPPFHAVMGTCKTKNQRLGLTEQSATYGYAAAQCELLMLIQEISP